MRKLIIFLLKIYKKTISKVFESMGIRCKFYPTCSEYCGHAVGKYGVVKGLWLGAKRLIRCNPFSKGGYDPLK